MTQRNVHHDRGHRDRRGLTLVELLLGMVITTFVAAAIASMMGAVTTGVMTRQDSRSVMIRSNQAQMRLSAYLAPSRCLLARDGGDLVVWVSDARESDTVHATEIRWLLFDADEGAIDAFFVEFPEGWTQAAKDLADLEYTSDTDWDVVFLAYKVQGHLHSKRLVDGLESCAVSTDMVSAMSSRVVRYQLGFPTEAGTTPMTVYSTILLHEPPTS